MEFSERLTQPGKPTREQFVDDTFFLGVTECGRVSAVVIRVKGFASSKCIPEEVLDTPIELLTTFAGKNSVWAG